MTKTILGIFEDRADVEAVMDDLQENGFNPKDVSIAMKNGDTIVENNAPSTGSNVVGGAASGVTTGAVIGGLAGLLAATVIPGLGAFLIGGPIAAALGLGGAVATTVSGAATGAVAGGLIGALMGLGLTKDEADYYESRINEGAILVAVVTNELGASDVIDIFNAYDASDVKTISASQRETEYASQDLPEHSHRFAFAGMKGGKSKRKLNK